MSEGIEKVLQRARPHNSFTSVRRFSNGSRQINTLHFFDLT